MSPYRAALLIRGVCVPTTVRTTALLVLTMGNPGLLCLDVPVVVLVYCYAMRSDRYNQGWVESHPRAGCTWLCLPHSVWYGTTMGVCSRV